MCIFTASVVATMSLNSSDSDEPFYMIRHRKLPCEEDLFNEFKGHRSMCAEEIKVRNGENSRRPVSHCICSMLNNGKGGSVYLGVLDNGQVSGIMMSKYTRDHLVLSLQVIYLIKFASY